MVCVHGLSRVGRDFDPLAAALAGDFRVLCPDVPGRGLSEWADDPADYAPEPLLNTLVGFCDKLDLDALCWIGTSMGGQPGMAAAAGPLRDRVSHLVVNDVGPAPDEDDGGVERIVKYLSDPPVFDALTGLEEYYRETYASFGDLSDVEWRRFTRTSARRRDDGRFTPDYDPRIVDPLLSADPVPDPWAMWESITANVFVIHGRNSDVLSDATFREMRERRPDTGTLEVNCGHAPALNDAEQIGAVRSFFG